MSGPSDSPDDRDFRSTGILPTTGPLPMTGTVKKTGTLLLIGTLRLIGIRQPTRTFAAERDIPPDRGSATTCCRGDHSRQTTDSGDWRSARWWSRSWSGVGFASRVSSKGVASPVAYGLPRSRRSERDRAKGRFSDRLVLRGQANRRHSFCRTILLRSFLVSSRRRSSGKSQLVSVPGADRCRSQPPKHASGPQAATVTLSAGVWRFPSGSSPAYGWSVTSCASRSSASWYFPQGSTVAGNNVTLDLYDPSVTQAVVDIDVVTASGEVDPTDYQGVAVPAGGLVTEKLDAHATNDPEVATIVEAASGSVVAEELQHIQLRTRCTASPKNWAHRGRSGCGDFLTPSSPVVARSSSTS